VSFYILSPEFPAAHLARRDDQLVKVRPLLEMIPDWAEYLGENISEETAQKFRHHEQTGRPLGTEAFVTRLEKAVGRILRPLKPWERKMSE